MIKLWKKITPGYMPFMDYNMPPPNNYTSQEINDIYKDPFFNPMMQYEQASSYYKYLCMQMDYKIKCKEYEKLCKSSSNSSFNNSQINDRRESK